MGKRTRIMFAEAVQELMNTKRLSEVRINDICRMCGANRNTFYYHFQDKYDLVGWIFVEDSMEAMIQEPDRSLEDKLEMGIGLIEEKKLFYKKALEEHSQNSLRQSMQNYNVELSLKVLKQYYGEEELPSELVLAVRYHSHGCIGLTIDWLNGQLDLTKREFAELQARRMPQKLKEAFQNVGKES